MELEAQLVKNTESIAALAQTVTELSTAMKYEVERARDDRTSVKELVSELKTISGKISEMGSAQKELSQATNTITELRARVEQLTEWKGRVDLTRLDSRVSVLESDKAKEQAVKATVTTGLDWFWRLFGNAITAGITVVLFWLVTHNTSSTTTIMEHSVHGAISGE